MTKTISLYLLQIIFIAGISAFGFNDSVQQLSSASKYNSVQNFPGKLDKIFFKNIIRLIFLFFKNKSTVTKMFYDTDISADILQDKKIAIIGCGSQGHAHALNLQDSGMSVKVGLRPTSKTCESARQAGLTVESVSEVSAWGDIIVILLPDTIQKDVYEADIAPNLSQFFQ